MVSPKSTGYNYGGSYTGPSGYDFEAIPNMTPEMIQFFNKMLGGVQGGSLQGIDYLSQLASGTPEAFEKAEAPAYRAFDQQLGNIGSRFSSFGGQGSSAFQNATAGAASEFSENLGANRMKIQQDAINKLLGLSTSLLGQEPYKNVLLQEDQGSNFGEQVAPVILQLIKMFATKGTG